MWEKTKLPTDKIRSPVSLPITPRRWNIQNSSRSGSCAFAKIVGRENVIASTDCGFAQAEGVQRVHPQVMWAKY